MASFPLTVKGAEKLRAELHKLKTVERPAVIQAIAEARAHGVGAAGIPHHAPIPHGQGVPDRRVPGSAAALAISFGFWDWGNVRTAFSARLSWVSLAVCSAEA